MRFKCVILFFFILTNPNVSAQYSKKDIKKIQKEYRKIQKELKFCNTKTFEIRGNSAEGGSATAYMKKRKILMISTMWLGETGKRIIKVYYMNDLPFFVFEQKYHYNRPIYYDKKMAGENNDPEFFDQNKSIITENRYYFKDGLIIRWIGHDKKDVDLSKDENRTSVSEVLEETRYVKNLFDQK